MVLQTNDFGTNQHLHKLSLLSEEQQTSLLEHLYDKMGALKS